MFFFPKQSLVRTIVKDISLDNKIIVDTYNNLRYKINNEIINIKPPHNSVQAPFLRVVMLIDIFA